MKLRISIDDLKQLDQGQKDNLSNLWLPQKYDLAAAEICTDAIEEKYEMLEFVVGDLRFHKDGSITLFDLAAMPGRGEPETEETELSEPVIPDIRHGTGPFNLINPLTGAFDSSIRSLVGDVSRDTAAKAGLSDDRDTLQERESDGAEEEEEYIPCLPDCFSKDTCLPLLNMVQMLEILERKEGPGRYDLFFSASAGGKTFAIGRIPSEWDSLSTDEIEAEPCDVLWEAVKALL